MKFNTIFNLVQLKKPDQFLNSIKKRRNLSFNVTAPPVLVFSRGHSVLVLADDVGTVISLVQNLCVKITTSLKSQQLHRQLTSWGGNFFFYTYALLAE